MKFASVIDLTSFHGRHYMCACQPGLKQNGWQATHDTNCSIQHAWIVGLTPGYYPWSRFE